jgi:hypothetical protein
MVWDSALCDTVFSVCDASGQQLPSGGPHGLAEIRKLRAHDMSGWLQEALSDADNLGCSFPTASTPADKAVLLSAVFLIDFMFFETSGGGQQTRRQRRVY